MESLLTLPLTQRSVNMHRLMTDVRCVKVRPDSLAADVSVAYADTPQLFMSVAHGIAVGDSNLAGAKRVTGVKE